MASLPAGLAKKNAEDEWRISRDADPHFRAQPRGAEVAGTQVHSLRLPGYTLAFETVFGLPDERLTIRHDAGTSAQPYVAGTLLAAERVLTLKGLIRGLDTLLFQ